MQGLVLELPGDHQPCRNWYWDCVSMWCFPPSYRRNHPSRCKQNKLKGLESGKTPWGNCGGTEGVSTYTNIKTKMHYVYTSKHFPSWLEPLVLPGVSLLAPKRIVRHPLFLCSLIAYIAPVNRTRQTGSRSNIWRIERRAWCTKTAGSWPGLAGIAKHEWSGVLNIA